MASMVEPTVAPTIAPDKTTEQSPDEKKDFDPGYLVIVWNDPVNFMDYVTHVFMKVFGWPKPKAETHMLEVHNQGRSVVAKEGFEKAEYYVHQLQGYHLQATMEKPG